MKSLDLTEHGDVHDGPGGPVAGNTIIVLRAGALRITDTGVGEVLQVPCPAPSPQRFPETPTSSAVR